ncbi:MAG: sugar ABC transporter permease [Halanaerobiales bacterium]|nr:sugar ABC transporter permease [Halanaerobiales bacterium]
MKKTISSKIGMVLFLLPAGLFFISFFVYPLVFIIITSFTSWDGLSQPVFNSWNNYRFVLSDPTFKLSIQNNIGWILAGGFLQVPLAVLVAILLARKPKGWKFLRTVYYFPNVISIVAMSMLWMAVFNSEYGILNGLLKAVGLEGLQQNWLGNYFTAYPAVVLFGVFYIGYFMIIILAEISSIPETYYEAASIDGASRLQQELHITLPLIRGSTLTCMTIAMVYGLRQFEQTYVMTNGGPANRTMVLVLYLFKKINDFQYGVANTSAVFLLMIGVIIIVGLRRLFRAKD